MRVLVRAVLAAAFLTSLGSLAQARVKIAIDLAAQTMHVEAGEKTFDWKVSSGKSGYETPSGAYRVLWMDKDHLSDTYDKAPMPNAIFFAPGYAIHGASKSAWGHPASHGCVRLPVSKSAQLFDLVKKQGAEITLTGGDANAEVAYKIKHRDDGVPPPLGTEAASYAAVPQDGFVPPDGAAPNAPAAGQPPAVDGYGAIYGQVY